MELARHLPQTAVDEIAYVMSGGTEGALSPHILVLERTEAGASEGSSLAIGSALTTVLAPWELGRLDQVKIVAEGVRSAMADAGISDPRMSTSSKSNAHF